MEMIIREGTSMRAISSFFLGNPPIKPENHCTLLLTNNCNFLQEFARDAVNEKMKTIMVEDKIE